jgi:16S rRNA U1498 N3-methylase RsmE
MFVAYVREDLCVSVAEIDSFIATTKYTKDTKVELGVKWIQFWLSCRSLVWWSADRVIPRPKSL